MSTPLDRVLERLHGPRRSGGGWSAHCPVHDDGSPSLSITEGADGRVLLKCHAGCEVERVVAALGLEMKDLVPNEDDAAAHRRSVATYDYTDESGTLLFQSLRYQPKDFRQRRPDGQGGWVWNLKGVRLVPYRLPQTIEAVAEGRWVFVVEGEKDADALVALGLVATTNPMGAGKWRSEYSEALRGAHVVLLPDNDEPGHQHMQRVASSLQAVAAEVRVVELPGLLPKGDVSDWIATEGTKDELQRLVREAGQWSSLVGDSPIGDETGVERSIGILLSEVESQRVRWLWKDRIPLRKVTVIDGDPGLGKSTLTLDIAARVSRGGVMPDGMGGGEPAGVVIVSAEDDLADTIVPRLHAAGADLDRIVAVTVCPDTNGEGEHPLSLPEDLDYVREAVERVDAKLLIIDPLMAMMSGKVDAHRDQDMRRLLHRLKLFAEETGCAVLVVRHLNKSGGSLALYRGGGSIGIIAAARAGFLVARDPDQQEGRVLAVTKMNLGPEPSSLAFHLEGTEDGACCIVWDGASDHRANALVAPPVSEEERGARAEAKDFLIDTLSDGPVSAEAVKRQARDAGIAYATLRLAEKDLGVIHGKAGMKGGWTWELPPQVLIDHRTCSVSEDEHLRASSEENEHLRGQEDEQVPCGEVQEW